MTQTSPDIPTSPQRPADDPDGDAALPGVVSRRAVVAGVGGVAWAGLLTACGGGSTATAPVTPAAPAPSADEAEPSEEESADDESADDESEESTTDTTVATADVSPTHGHGNGGGHGKD